MTTATATAAAAAAAAAAAMVFDETKLLSAALVAGNKLLTNLSINSAKQLQQQQQQQFSNLSRYKTELCRQFSENGETKIYFTLNYKAIKNFFFILAFIFLIFNIIDKYLKNFYIILYLILINNKIM